VRVQIVTATTSMARVRAKRVKSTVFPANGGGAVGGAWCWFGESCRGWKKREEPDRARLRVQPESRLSKLKAYQAERKVQMKRSRVIAGRDCRKEALLPVTWARATRMARKRRGRRVAPPTMIAHEVGKRLTCVAVLRM
jgi:hypothetical protein